MSANFDWQTEEEDGWESENVPRQHIKASRLQFGKRFILIGIGLLAILLIGFLFFAEKRLESNSELMESDVLATHQVLIQAIMDRDIDRFKSMLAADARAWNDFQNDLLRHQLILSREPLGINGPDSIPSYGLDSDLQIALSAQLDRAEVKDIFTYTINDSEETSKEIQLEQTFHYQVDGTSWLLSDISNADDYWGPWHRIEENLIAFAYTERDADIGARLSSDLATLVAKVCKEQVVECKPDFHLTVRFSNSKSSLLRLQEGVYNNRILVGYGPATVELPTPTIVGQPIDEAGYQALYQAYGSWITAIMMTNYSTNFQELGIDTINEHLLDLNLVLLPEPAPAVPLQARIPFPSEVKPPNQNIMMLCSGSEFMVLLQYNVDRGEWLHRISRVFEPQGNYFTGFPAGLLTRSADYKGVIYVLQEAGEGGPVWRLYRWLSGREQLLAESEQPLFVWPPLIRQGSINNNQSILMYKVHLSENESSVDFWELDLSDCEADRCGLEKIDIIPLWSPTNDYALMVEPLSDNLLKMDLANDKGEIVEPIGVGHSPTWIANESFAYVTQHEIDSGSSELTGEQSLNGYIIGVEPNAGFGTVSWMLQSEKLQLAIPASDRPDGLAFTSARTAGRYNGLWYILANNVDYSTNGTSYLFLYDEPNDDLQLIETYFGQLIDYSSMQGIDDQHYGYIFFDGQSVRYMVFDSSDGDIREVGDSQPYDQSADGGWLIFPRNDGLRIASVSYQFDWTLEHELSSCSTAVWVDKE